MSFPIETIPDGNVWAPHHFTYGAWAALFVCWLATTDDNKAWVAISGLLIALFSWYHFWATVYPVTGAIGVLAGLAIATAAVVARDTWRTEYDWRLRASCILCLLVAWDDALEHAFGVWMPLDWIWRAYLWQFVP